MIFEEWTSKCLTICQKLLQNYKEITQQLIKNLRKKPLARTTKKEENKWHEELIITPAVCHSEEETDTRCCWEPFHYLVHNLQSCEGATCSSSSLAGINVRHLGTQKRSAEPTVILFEWWIQWPTPRKFAASLHHLLASLLKLACLEKLGYLCAFNVSSITT